MTNKKLFNTYANIKAKIKSLSEEEKELKPLIMEILLAKTNGERGDYIESELGKATISERRNYEYPDYVKEKEAELDDIKKISKQKGDGDYEINKSFVFKVYE